MPQSVVPYPKLENKTKKEQVAMMFDNISARYDFLNRLLSVGIDVYWRNKTLSYLKADQPQVLLDVATGTGDLALAAFKKLKPKQIIGIDISEGMLNIGKTKVKKAGLENYITLEVADAEQLPFADNTFDAVVVAFGVRNFEHLDKGLTDIKRVLKKEGKLVVLEFSKPKNFPVKQFYSFYFRYVLPKIGKLVSKDSSAYTYLPQSVNAFPEGEEFLSVMDHLGYKNTLQDRLTFGIASVYVGQK